MPFLDDADERRYFLRSMWAEVLGAGLDEPTMAAWLAYLDTHGADATLAALYQTDAGKRALRAQRRRLR